MMMQALTPPASFFFVQQFLGKGILATPIQDVLIPREGRVLSSLAGYLWSASIALCQQPKVRCAPGSALTPEKALALAKQGRCRESMSGLRRAMGSQLAPATKKQIGVVGVRCSLAVDDRDSTPTLSAFCTNSSPLDPDVLFVVTMPIQICRHALRKILAEPPRNHFAAHKLNAEALETQGKWGPAQLEYEGMIQKEPIPPASTFSSEGCCSPDLMRDQTRWSMRRRNSCKRFRSTRTTPVPPTFWENLTGVIKKWDEAISRYTPGRQDRPKSCGGLPGLGAIAW